jgi:hypothetical protein
VAFMGQEDISPAKAPGNSPTFLGQLKQLVALVPVGTALPAGLPERGPLSLSATVRPAARPRTVYPPGGRGAHQGSTTEETRSLGEVSTIAVPDRLLWNVP